MLLHVVQDTIVTIEFYYYRYHQPISITISITENKKRFTLKTH